MTVTLAFFIHGPSACSEAETASHSPADATAEGAHDPDAACRAVACQGVCSLGRCVQSLATIASPMDLAVDDTGVYVAACSANGGVVLRIPVELAAGPTCPVGLALGAGAVYVAGLLGPSIASVPQLGGAASAIASGDAPVEGPRVFDTSVFWASKTALLKAPLGGGAITTLASGQARFTRPVVDETGVYFGDPDRGTVTQVARDGGPTTLVTSGLDVVSALALGGADVYIASGYVVAKAKKSGGPPVTVGTAAGAEVIALAADDRSVYFASDGAIWKIPFEGGVPEALATGQSSPTALAVTADAVYWANRATGTVMKVTPK